MTDYRPDAGGQFRSDVHRRVVSHLSLPDEGFGYTPTALFARLEPDFHTPIASLEDLKEVLDELEQFGLADEPEENVFRMTQEGFDLLTGPIADEPDPDEPSRPVRLDQPTPLRGHLVSGTVGA